MNNSLMERMINEQFSLVSIDLFSGPGGLCTGFKWAGILPLIAVEWTDTTVETYSVSHNAEVLHLSEYSNEDGINEEYLEQFMSESTRTLLIHGDINLVSSNMIRNLLQARYGLDSVNETVDVVSGGAPCESFSLAGTRTLGDERDDLFSNIIRISRTVNTKAILFENVKGMFSKRNAEGERGAIFHYICDTFENEDVRPGYKLISREQSDILLKACDYGVPQARERLFLVGIRRDLENVNFSYPEKTHGPGRQHPYVTVEDAISDLPRVGMGEGTDLIDYTQINQYVSDNQRDFVSIMRGHYNDNRIHSYIPHYLVEQGLFMDNVVSVHKGPGHIRRKQDLLALIRERETMRSAFERLTEEGQIDQYRHLFPNTIYASRNRRLLWDEPSFTVTSHCLDEILHPTLNRAITPREAARLQSFPDWYQFAGPYVQFHGDKVQDKYEQIGDAIPPLLASALARQFVQCLPAHIE
ncbi:MAG: DNA cytosine methyltransferase [Lachnospiraceae bacterium]|nr:DNA cytosine methyltransferase [Lachnospiraceae bacterium]